MIIKLNNPVYTPHFFYQVMNKKIDIATDTFKAILMDDSYFFLPQTHLIKATINASQIATGNGYTQDSKILTGGTLTEDAANFRAYRTFDGFSWTASGGALPNIGTLLIYDDTTSDDTIVCGYDFGLSALQTCTYVGATSFTIDEDQTASILVGMRIRLVQTTDASVTVSGVSYSVGTDKTTVTTTGVDSGLTGAYFGTIYSISNGVPFPVEPVTLELGQEITT